MKKNLFLFFFLLFFLNNSIINLCARPFYIKESECNSCKKIKKENVFQKKFRAKEKLNLKEEHNIEEICKWEKPFLNQINDDETTHNLDYKKLDPWEKKNKRILKFNLFIFRNTILPFIYLIDAWVPRPVQDLFINFTHNMLEPKNYLVYKFSGEDEKARICAERFFINSFFGAGGLMNMAEEKYGSKYQRINEKFDYIFYKKSIHKGRYIVIPIINEHYERELASDLIEWLVNPIFYFTLPFNYIYYGIYRSILLTDKKQTLYYNRHYDDAVYNNLRDLKTYEVSNY